MTTDNIKKLADNFELICANKSIQKLSEEQVSGNYSSIMRALNKSYSEETINNFQKIFKDAFDQAFLVGEEHPEEIALKEAIKCISSTETKIAMVKLADGIELGNPQSAGAYLANMARFLLNRISEERRPKAIDGLKKKIYYLNEYELASKRMPASASIGQSIVLIKHLLYMHDPVYIRQVLNSIVANL